MEPIRRKKARINTVCERMRPSHRMTNVAEERSHQRSRGAEEKSRDLDTGFGNIDFLLVGTEGQGTKTRLGAGPQGASREYEKEEGSTAL